MLDFGVGEMADQAMQEFLAEKNLRKALIRLGIAYLTRQLAHPRSPSPHRRDPAGRVALGAEFYENILRPAWKRLAEAFKALMNSRGDSDGQTPGSRRCNGKALVLLDLYERRLLGAAIGRPIPGNRSGREKRGRGLSHDLRPEIRRPKKGVDLRIRTLGPAVIA